MLAVLKSVFAYVCGFAVWLAWALVVHTGWQWFAVPMGAPAMTYNQAAGLLVVGWVLSGCYGLSAMLVARYKEDYDSPVARYYGMLAAAYVSVWLAMWLAKTV